MLQLKPSSVKWPDTWTRLKWRKWQLSRSFLDSVWELGRALPYQRNNQELPDTTNLTTSKTFFLKNSTAKCLPATAPPAPAPAAARAAPAAAAATKSQCGLHLRRRLDIWNPGLEGSGLWTCFRHGEGKRIARNE
ncbi:hypothetical protein TCAP_03754 [Tolypocladium capitatum]|uniref:Uncharacterized protein n=1 Tax=Tolypocladium capitatum TaxID=45235 RepID=A0A2K3QFK3_9HYPO|nr:hypothetical protein TCAP_03754 [Tolypocladium capitatum]